MTIRDELLALKNVEGMIVVENAVQWARDNPQSELHQALQWNDAAAANNWRHWQVRQLIAIHVVSNEGVRQVVSLSIDRANKNGGGYREMNDVLARKDLRDVLLDDALADLERLQKKYNTVKELAEVWAAKDNVQRRRRARPEASGAQISA